MTRCPAIHDYSPPRSLILRCALVVNHEGPHRPRHWEHIDPVDLYELMTEELNEGSDA